MNPIDWFESVSLRWLTSEQQGRIWGSYQRATNLGTYVSGVGFGLGVGVEAGQGIIVLCSGLCINWFVYIVCLLCIGLYEFLVIVSHDKWFDIIVSAILLICRLLTSTSLATACYHYPYVGVWLPDCSLFWYWPSTAACVALLGSHWVCVTLSVRL